MEMISATVIWQVSKAVYSMINSTSSLLEKKGKEQLQIAYRYLNDSSASISLIRMALQHMETAYTMFDKDPIIKADKRIRQLNELCYYIAKLHYELGDPYDSTTKSWAWSVDHSIYPPEGLKCILNENDWNNLVEEYRRYNAPDPDSYTYDDPVWMANLRS